MQTAVEQYLTEYVQDFKSASLKSGVFTQSLTHVKVKTPDECGSDSSITMTQDIDGVAIVMSALDSLDAEQMAVAIVPQFPKYTNQASRVANTIRETLNTLVVQEMVSHQSIRYVVIESACHVQLSSSIVVKFISEKLSDAIVHSMEQPDTNSLPVAVVLEPTKQTNVGLMVVGLVDPQYGFVPSKTTL